MSLRLLRNIAQRLKADSGAGPLDAEILAEQAAALGRAGSAVESALQALRAHVTRDAERRALVQAAADAVHGFLIQRELCGFRRHDDVISHYAIPREVLARVGAK